MVGINQNVLNQQKSKENERRDQVNLGQEQQSLKEKRNVQYGKIHSDKNGYLKT